MCVRAAELSGPAVHHVHERVHGTGAVLRELVGDIICRFEQQHIETLLHGKCFPVLCPRVGASRCRHLRPGRSHGDSVVHGAVFDHEKSGQNLRCTCRIADHGRVLGIQNRAILGVHEESGLFIDVAHLRPALDLIGHDLFALRSCSACLLTAGLSRAFLTCDLPGRLLRKGGNCHGKCQSEHKEDRYQ